MTEMRTRLFSSERALFRCGNSAVWFDGPVDEPGDVTDRLLAALAARVALR
jgi:hypothetical protein